MVINIAARVVAAVTLYAAIAGCAGAKMPFGGGAAASDPRCEIDAVKICHETRDKAVTMGVQQADSTMIEQNQPATMWQTVPIEDDRGEPIAQVQCHINTRRKNVIYAQALSGPPLTDTSVEKLRSWGYCKN